MNLKHIILRYKTFNIIQFDYVFKKIDCYCSYIVFQIKLLLTQVAHGIHGSCVCVIVAALSAT